MTSRARSQWAARLALLAAVVALLAVALRVPMHSDGPASPPPPILVAIATADVPGAVPESGAATQQRCEIVDDEPTVRAFAKLRCAVGTWHRPYVGDYEVRDDRGRVVVAGATPNNDEIAFALPVAARALVVVAPQGYRAVHIDALGEGERRDLGEILFTPDAALRLAVTGLPPDFRGTVAVAVDDGPTRCGQVGGALDVDGAIEVAVPSGRALRWQLAADGAAFACVLRGDAVPLAAGESRTIAVACAAVRSQRFRVVDVGAALLPHLIVRGRRNASAGVRLDADGGGELRSDIAEDAPYLEGDDAVALVASLRPAALLGYLQDEILLRPWVPVAGVQLRAPDGALVPFHLDLSGAPHGPAMRTAAIHVVERRKLDVAPFATVWTEATGSLRMPASAWAGQGDLFVLDARAGEATAALCVTGTGQRPRSAIAVQVCDGVGNHLTSQQCEAVTGTATILGLGPGTYDLRWIVGHSLEPCASMWIARGIAFTPGERRELAAPWPVRVAWTGEVAAWNDLPQGRRFHSLRFGGGDSLAGGGARVPLDRDGRFSFELAPDAEPTCDAALFHAMMAVRTEVASVDAAAHHVVVALPADVHWVDLDVALPRSARWTALVWRADRPELPWMVVRDDDRRPLLVPPGVVLGGVLTDGHGFGEGEHAIAFFAADGSAPTVRVAPTGGHWVEVRGPASAWLQPVGPGGAGGPWLHPGVDGTARLWVPDGTMTVRSGRAANGQASDGQEFDPAVTAIELR